MNRCLINRIKRISNTLHKDIVEPIKILCVYKENGLLNSSLLADSELVENCIFKTEEELELYIKENKIINVIKNLCFDRI